MSKSLSKYIASFYYLDKSLIVLSVTTGTISIAQFATVIGAPVGIESASFSLAFSIFTGIVKKNCLKSEEIQRKSIIKVLCYRLQTYEKQGRATIARLATKFRSYRLVKSRKSTKLVNLCNGGTKDFAELLEIIHVKF